MVAVETGGRAWLISAFLPLPEQWQWQWRENLDSGNGWNRQAPSCDIWHGVWHPSNGVCGWYSLYFVCVVVVGGSGVALLLMAMAKQLLIQ